MINNIVNQGKTKRITSLSAATCSLEFSDHLVDLANHRKEALPGKGEIGAAMTAYLFNCLEQHGVKTHFVEKKSANSLKIKLLQMIPLEIVIRGSAYGSFYKRYGIVKGKRFEQPVVEYFLKDDALDDPLINSSALTALGILTMAQVNIIEEICLKVWQLVSEEFVKVGIELIDIKLEFGTIGDAFFLGDEIGFDTLRIRDAITLERLDKDVWYSKMDGVGVQLFRLRQKISGWL